jgi:opacity protein-like surface antigen
MNTKIALPWLASCLGGLGAFATPAIAEEHPIKESATISMDHHSGLYVTAGVGANWPVERVGYGEPGSFTEFSSPGFATEVGVGYDFRPLRLELTYALDASKLQGYDNVAGQYYKYNQGGQTRKNSAFASFYWDLLPGRRLSPYLGGGVGLSSLDIREFSETGLNYKGYSKSLFGYQAKAGLSYAVDNRSKVFAEAIYRGTSGYSTNDGYDTWSNASFSSWGAQAGLRIGL